MRQLEYTIILHPEVEKGGYWVEIPALPACISYGETLAQAIDNAKDAIKLYVESLMEDGEPVPEETEHPQALVVKVAA
ncbi:MAG: type II toxin-antitoxin system HicB family antitoxin [Chloroflexi bacterium]|nr:type II toxin-antitoxin system HicB family antitoxin [Chloroflexota bacterium]